MDSILIKDTTREQRERIVDALPILFRGLTVGEWNTGISIVYGV